ncbi:MAG: hypothetical protein OWQ56_01565 [Acidithiobacillus caldus]|nr:hypothetical protein [Acidithiobacillus caldus]
MSDIELAVEKSRKLEQALEAGFGARGRGLHEKITSVEGKLPRNLVKQLRWVATIRNHVVHEGTKIADPTTFAQSADRAYSAIQEIVAARRVNASKKPNRSGWIVTLLIAVLLAALIGLYVQSH